MIFYLQTLRNLLKATAFKSIIDFKRNIKLFLYKNEQLIILNICDICI